LRLVDWQNLLDAFELQQQATFRQHIKPQGLIEDQALVFDPDQALIDGADAAQLQFPQKTPLIDALDQTGPLKTVNLNGRANNLAAQVVSFLKERMQVPLLHQANEGNEEFCRAPSRAYRGKEGLHFHLKSCSIALNPGVIILSSAIAWAEYERSDSNAVSDRAGGSSRGRAVVAPGL